MGTQESEQAANATAATTLFLRIVGFAQAQMTGNGAGVKTPLDVLPPQDCQEQTLVLVAERIEGATTMTLKRDRVAGAVQDPRADPGVLDHGQRIKIAIRGLA